MEISPSELLDACAWLMASTGILEAYLFKGDRGITVRTPLPYSILSGCYSEGTRTTTPISISSTNCLDNAWTAVEETAHSAKRLHGRSEILQKQLQHECVRHITLESRMHRLMGNINIHATPYEALVAADPALLEKHLDGLSVLSADVRMRQAAVELIPHFLRWTSDCAERFRQTDDPSMCSHLGGEPHRLMMPRRTLQYDAGELEQVLMS